MVMFGHPFFGNGQQHTSEVFRVLQSVHSHRVRIQHNCTRTLDHQTGLLDASHLSQKCLCTQYNQLALYIICIPSSLAQVIHTQAYPQTPGSLGAIEYLFRRIAFVCPQGLMTRTRARRFSFCSVELSIDSWVNNLSIIGSPGSIRLSWPNLTKWLVRGNGGKPLI